MAFAADRAALAAVAMAITVVASKFTRSRNDGRQAMPL
jgi:hypothetical protein